MRVEDRIGKDNDIIEECSLKLVYRRNANPLIRIELSEMRVQI